MRVLVVEDFEILARSIGIGLRREGMAVDGIVISLYEMYRLVT
jgi:hypothetical protein